MLNTNEITVETRPEFTAVGLKWEGTFSEAGAGSIRAVHARFLERRTEILHQAQSDRYYGLSYHAHPGAPGFVHFAVMEVSAADRIPEGMELVRVPALTYARLEHQIGQSIEQSYANIFAWIESQGYGLADEDLTHFEVYPLAQDPYDKDPAFTILIPIRIDA